mmetsp:Transcript_103486/g.166853  ORF Transcript_103486/g.166853 Transcript_103486/m.166853 type:complete len:234 (+) Transcript_103486:28-729(+)
MLLISNPKAFIAPSLPVLGRRTPTLVLWGAREVPTQAFSRHLRRASGPNLIMSSGTVTVRAGCRDDAHALLVMIQELAEFEKELDQVQMTVETLQRDGWPLPDEVAAGQQVRFETLFAEVGGLVVGFALFFHNYSTWEGVGVYLEDLYVNPEQRGKGVGTALMRAVAQVAQDRGCSRFQWQAIDFNSPAIEYYKNKLGARERMETGDAKWMNFIMNRQQVDSFLSKQTAHKSF